jgi:putative Ig domain-containing protein
VPLNTVTQPIVVAIMSVLAAGHRSTKPAAPALAISGHATETIEPTAFYAFTPDVQSRDGRKLRFSIRNKPAWASFGLKRGTLYGTPQNVHAGTYSNIVITVSDGHSSVDLPPFSITVGPPAVVAAAEAR